MTQEISLARLDKAFPYTNEIEFKGVDESYRTFVELTNTSIRDFGVSTRVVAISTNDEYLGFLRDTGTIYYELASEDLPPKWYFQSTYWRYQILDKIALAFRTDYKVFIPNQCYPMVLTAKGIYVVVAPMYAREHYKLSLALPDCRTGMEKYDKLVQDDIRAGYKWKLEFEKNDLRGIRKVFGYYTSKPHAYNMGSIVSDQGNFVFLSKVKITGEYADSQYSEALLFD